MDGAEQLADLGWQCLRDEWQFNEAVGFTSADDNLPECCRKEGIGLAEKLGIS
jgi:hypothetical protein